MRQSQLSAAIVLLLLASATAVAWAAAARIATAGFTPPPEPGLIYTVINYSRSGGQAQHTLVSLDFGGVRRDLVVPGPYTSNPCFTATPSGFALRLRHNQPDSPLLKIATNGTIVRGPYQGDVPMELLHACYKLVK